MLTWSENLQTYIQVENRLTFTTVVVNSSQSTQFHFKHFLEPVSSGYYSEKAMAAIKHEAMIAYQLRTQLGYGSHQAWSYDSL